MLKMDRMTSDVNRTGGPVERDVEQAITALKKGAYLLKYGRRGKPKFCPFRLANDESVLIWFSGKEEKQLKLSHVSRIVSGQRTPIFQRYPRPEKESQSFSLIYNDRSLDLICKDKDEAEVWFGGLKTLISRGHQRKWRTESRSDGIPSEANSPRTYTRRSSPLHSPFGSGDS
ncbi:1-phosphatidylinositol 4,5-bisphosphate phosphodiesterase, partial [Actinidia chinensis var. chinensis]